MVMGITYVGDNDLIRLETKILDLLRTSGPLTAHELHLKLSGRITADRLRELLEALVRIRRLTKKVVRRGKRGRSTDLYALADEKSVTSSD